MGDIRGLEEPQLEQYDVVVVGAGPAGMMTATGLARMGIKPLVIDSTDHAGHQYGRSDAFQSRCMEVMQSFGAPIEQLEHMGKKLYGRTFWEITDEQNIARTGYARFYPEFLDYDKDYSLAVRQGLIEQVLAHDIERHYKGFKVQWNTQFVSMELPKPGEEDGYSTSVVIKDLQTGIERTVECKYVVACDGAKSTIRRWASQFGVKLEGATLPVTWCVLDAVGLRSDHPDLEKLCVVRSTKGIVLVIPREPINGKPAARFDIQINKGREDTTCEDATEMIKAIFHPFKVEWDEVNWWSIYDVGQRIINQYSVDNRVFFVGDTCHTHSPRAGMGLNTALLEGHNLAWKLALVLKGVVRPSILSTYATERHAVGKQLVSMDRQLVGLYAGLEQQSTKDFTSEATAQWLEKLRLFQAENYAFQAGASVVYGVSELTVTPTGEPETMTVGKPGVAIGSRTRPAVVTRLADSVPVPILPRFDGKFSIYIFVGSLEAPNVLENLKAIDNYIRNSGGSIFSKYGANVDVHAKAIADRMPTLRIPNGSATIDPNFAEGRLLYTHDYEDIPQVCGEYLAPPHTLFRVSVITTTSAQSPLIQGTVLDMLYPLESDQPENKRSRILHPAYFFSDDIPIVSPYRETAPEAGTLFENPMHQKWAVDPSVGSIVIARPDAHVGTKTVGFGVEAWKQVESYFRGFLV
ncbi:hypothetical protein VNI00_004118 [Paramarasmius palmivorus]|uniref:Uncharacterized protein n=1 Tax=Paramarasmius palmivorus TaxID=297713 RepID=A0AAW0DKY4_9AGAR